MNIVMKTQRITATKVSQHGDVQGNGLAEED